MVAAGERQSICVSRPCPFFFVLCPARRVSCFGLLLTLSLWDAIKSGSVQLQASLQPVPSPPPHTPAGVTIARKWILIMSNHSNLRFSPFFLVGREGEGKRKWNKNTNTYSSAGSIRFYRSSVYLFVGSFLRPKGGWSVKVISRRCVCCGVLWPEMKAKKKKYGENNTPSHVNVRRVQVRKCFTEPSARRVARGGNFVQLV